MFLVKKQQQGHGLLAEEEGQIFHHLPSLQLVYLFVNYVVIQKHKQ